MAKSVASIHSRNGYEGSYTYYPIVVIGAGISGIAMGCRLKQVLGFDQFRIFERQSGIGGTWWINTYPGVACDVYVFLDSLPQMHFLRLTFTGRRSFTLFPSPTKRIGAPCSPRGSSSFSI